MSTHVNGLDMNAATPWSTPTTNYEYGNYVLSDIEGPLSSSRDCQFD